MKKIFGICLLLYVCFVGMGVHAAGSYYYYKVANSSGGYDYLMCDTEDYCTTYTEEQITAKKGVISGSIIRMSGNVYSFMGTKGNSSSGSDTQPGTGTVTPTTGDPVTPSGDTTTTTTTTTKEEKAPTTNTCERLKEPLKFIGHIVTIFKIVIPLLLIVFGIMDFFKAVTAGKDDEIKKSTKTFAFRVLAGVVIFFLPTIVSFVFSMVDSWAEVEGDFDACQKCVFRVSQCE